MHSLHVFCLHACCMHCWIMNTGTATSARSVWFVQLVWSLDDSLFRYLFLSRRPPSLVLIKLELFGWLLLVSARAVIISWHIHVAITARLRHQIRIRSIWPVVRFSGRIQEQTRFLTGNVQARYRIMNRIRLEIWVEVLWNWLLLEGWRNRVFTVQISIFPILVRILLDWLPHVVDEVRSVGHMGAKFWRHVRTPSRIEFDGYLHRSCQIFGHRPQSVDSFMCQLILLQQAFGVVMVVFLLLGSDGRTSTARCLADRTHSVVVIIWIAPIYRFTPYWTLRVIFIHRIVYFALGRQTSRGNGIVINGHRFCVISALLVRLVSQRHKLGSIYWALFSSSKRWRSVNAWLV